MSPPKLFCLAKYNNTNYITFTEIMQKEFAIKILQK